MQSQIKFEFFKEQDKLRFNQGDILINVPISSQGVDTATNEGIVVQDTLEYAIIVSQDCDLEQDFKAKTLGSAKGDKYLPNILLLPAYLEENFKQGKHRNDKVQAEAWESKLYKSIRNNNHSRFHFISENQDLQVPNLVIDFKHLYTLNRDFLYYYIKTVYLVSIAELYRENLSQRYTQYLSRIGLPDL